MANFGDTERYVKNLFVKGKKFTYQGVTYTVLESGKPMPLKGECKTDVYVRVLDETNNEKEFKISIKKKNADFLENKIRLERAIEILGDEAQEIIEKSLRAIKQVFEDSPLVYFQAHGNTRALSITMGWRFEFINKLGGKKAGLIQLTDRQKMNVYAGTELSQDKKDCKVNGSLVRDSGVANYIMVVEDVGNSLEHYLDNMQSIEDYIKDKEIYFACKALNYRCGEGKWEANRALAVYVDWTLKNNKLYSKLVFDKPLSIEGGVIGNHVKEILSSLKITKDNFADLKLILDKGTKFFG